MPIISLSGLHVRHEALQRFALHKDNYYQVRKFESNDVTTRTNNSKVVTVLAGGQKGVENSYVFDGDRIVKEIAQTIRISNAHEILCISRFALAQGFCEPPDSDDFDRKELEGIMADVIANSRAEDLHVDGRSYGCVWTKTYHVSSLEIILQPSLTLSFRRMHLTL